MELIISEKKSMSKIIDGLNKKYGNYVYEREDMIFDGTKRKQLASGINKNPLKKVLTRDVVEINDSDGTKFICDDGSWLLVRFSGTEPKLRIYSETNSKKKSLEYIKFGKKYALGFLK